MPETPEAQTPAPCGQCGKQSVVFFGVVHLCVSCYYEFEVARTLGFRIAAIGQNNAAAHMDFITGMPLTPRIQVPDLPKGPIHMHNIKVDNSVVGAINTAEVHTIDVNITYLKQGGNAQLGEVLKRLTEAIANTKAIGDEERQNLLDQVAYLSEQAASAAKDRKPGMVKAALSAIASGATAVEGIEAAWNAAEPLLKSLFGNG